MSREHECPVRRALAKQLALADPGGRFGWTADGRALTNGDVAAMLDAGDPLVDDLVEDCYGALARVFRLGGADRVVVVKKLGWTRHVVYCGEGEARELEELVREVNEREPPWVHGWPRFQCDVREPSSFEACRVELECAVRAAASCRRSVYYRFVVVRTHSSGKESVVACLESRGEADDEARRIAEEFGSAWGVDASYADGCWRVAATDGVHEWRVRDEGPEDAA